MSLKVQRVRFMQRPTSRTSTTINKLLGCASLWLINGVGLRVGGGLITLPLALKKLSPAELGLYYTFVGLTGLVMLLDFGFSQTIGRNAAFAMGGAKEFQAIGIPESSGNSEPNWTLLAKLLAAVKIWYHGAGILIAMLMLLPGSLFLIPLIETAGLSQHYLTCWWLFAGVTVYSFVSTYWPGLLFGIGTVKSAARIGMISQGIGLVLLIAALLMGAGLWSYGISSFVSTTISLMMTRRAFSQEAGKSLRIEVDRHSRNQVLITLWPMAWRQGLVMIEAFLIQRGNTLICSHELGLEETVSCGLTSNILNLIFQVVIIPLGLAWLMIGRLRVERDFEKIRQIFILRLYGGLVVAIISLYCLARWDNWGLELLGTKTYLLQKSILALLRAITRNTQDSF